MFYTITAAVLFLIGLGLLFYNIFWLQNIDSGRFFDRKYARRKEFIKARIDSVGVQGKNDYVISCDVDGKGTCVDIEVSSEQLNRLQAKREIYLSEYQAAKAKIYCIAPLMDIADIRVPIKKIEDSTCSEEEVAALDSKARTFHHAEMVLLAAAFFLCPNSSLASIILSVLAIIFSVLVVPLKRWTNVKGIVIIKTDSGSKAKKANNKGDKPIGFDDWSETNKELFSIEQRLRGITQEPAPKEDPDEGASAAVIPEEVTPSEVPEQEEQQPDKPIRFCKHCGCIVSETAQFCESCGAKLSEDILAEKVEEPVKEEPKAELSVQEEPKVDETVSVAKVIAETVETVKAEKAESQSAPELEKESPEPSFTFSDPPPKATVTVKEQETIQEAEQKPAKRQQMNHRPRKKKRKPAISDELAEMIDDISAK